MHLGDGGPTIRLGRLPGGVAHGLDFGAVSQRLLQDVRQRRRIVLGNQPTGAARLDQIFQAGYACRRHRFAGRIAFQHHERKRFGSARRHDGAQRVLQQIGLGGGKGHPHEAHLVL